MLATLHRGPIAIDKVIATRGSHPLPLVTRRDSARRQHGDSMN
jgi:hypothetical protein